jgi:hypothetical protein
MPKLTLVDDRVASGLANNQIGPLHHDDRHEKGRVAGVFQLLTGVVSLSIIRREIQYCRCCAKICEAKSQTNSNDQKEKTRE